MPTDAQLLRALGLPAAQLQTKKITPATLPALLGCLIPNYYFAATFASAYTAVLILFAQREHTRT